VLEVLGLAPVAESIYALLLDRPGFGVAELVDHLGLSEGEVRAGLDELADLTLLRPSRENPGRLRVVRPEVGVELFLRRQEEELTRRAHELAANKAAAARLVARYAELAPDGNSDRTEQLFGIDAIQDRLEVLARTMESECLSVMPGGGQSQGSLDASRPLDEAAMKRGVALLTLYQDSVRNDRATYAYARWMTDEGGQVRTAPLLPPRMLIVDRKIAVVPIDLNDTKRGALVTREPAIVASLVAIYQQAWDTAIPLGADQDRRGRDRDGDQDGESGAGLSPGEKELLLLLAKGMTDEAAAKRLGVSLRTVRRQMAGLMERLGATSRFEAGLKAAQRGWL
jgi:DNA-binding CsgD family transcriptional regulator/sugar-specific transcriptional regulator TrmB